VAQASLASLGLKSKPDAGESKARLLRLLRSRLPDAALAWLDAATVITSEDPKYPAILGSGGNDGRLDFANNFMQRIAEIFVPAKAESERVGPALVASLTGKAEKRVLVKAAIGQFAPANAGGSNMTAGLDADSRVNRWDFVLAIEGALVFAGAASRRFQNDDSGRASFPFHFNPSASGFYGE
jgi:CRISPR-associated protein Csx17